MKNQDDKLAKLVKDTLITTHDFPRTNFIYRGVVPLLKNGGLYQQCVDRMVEYVKQTDADIILSPELCGCLFAASVAYRLGYPLVVARKSNKLPREVYSIDYANEYQKETLQIHQDVLRANNRVFIIDDVISTGGTLFALRDLAKKTGASVAGAAFLFETVLMTEHQWKVDFPIFSIAKYFE